MRNDNELVPGLVLPPAYHALFRRRLAEVEAAGSAVNCLIAQARAESLVEALEAVTHGIAALHIERLYLLIEDAATARLAELEREQ